MIWNEIEYFKGQGYLQNFCQKKTKGVEGLPISKQAYYFCGLPEEPNAKVIKGLEYYACNDERLFQRI